MHIAIITAGGAGMFCGSCMHDNTWARALIDAGAEVSLIPTYTPIRVDEHNVSERHVYLGGVNLYLEHRLKLWRRLPRFLTRPLDHPLFLRLISRLSISNDAAELGDLTLDMLAGESGPIAREVDELAHHVLDHLKPDVVVFSNALLSGALRRLKERFAGPVYCVLQGDDVFTDNLPDSHRQRVIDALSERAQQFDGFFTHTKFYRDYMAAYLRLPLDRFHVIPLGIDLSGHDGVPRPLRHAVSSAPRGRAGRHEETRSSPRSPTQPFTIGYFARIAPEKGLHHLVDAALILQDRRPGTFVIRAGGYLNPQHRRYLARVQQSAAALGDAFRYIGSPKTLAEKVAFYKSLDVLSVPTEFQEPKGLYVLEALANGVPVVQPAHGAFPELIEATGGGVLVDPRNPEALANGLEQLLDDPHLRHECATCGQQRVRNLFNHQRMAAQTLEILRA